jgi:hypothetical protein
MMTPAECIALFVTPVIQGSANAGLTARLAVEQFVSSYALAPTGPLAALHELEAAVRELRLDGAVAKSVLMDIQARIAAATSAIA